MKNTLLASVILLAIFGNSCNKPYSNTNTNPGVYSTYSSLDTIYQILNIPSKFVTFDASVGSSFYGNSGTRYIFPAGIFQDASGNIITGIVQVEVKELLNKGDMIFAKALPICGNDPLLSGGEIYTSATQSGQQLYLRPGYTFQANIPQGKTPLAGMSYFTGPVVNNPVNIVAWKPGQDSLAHGLVVYNGDTISIISDSLHWCNADEFMGSPNYQTFKVTLTIAGSNMSIPSGMNTYTLYDNYKGVWTMGNMGTLSSYSNGVYSETHVPNIPVHFASFGIINNKFYGGVTAATPITNGNYTIILNQVDPVAFKGQLNNLTN